MRPFKPAPEPKPVSSFPAPGTAAQPNHEVMKELVRKTADLGFSRESHATPPSAPAQTLAPPQPLAAPKLDTKKAAPATAEPVPSWSIKFDAENELYMELLMESRRRRVTLKYLILQILKDQGYTVDLDKAAEDGRRNR